MAYSAGRRGHLLVLGALEQCRVVGRGVVHGHGGLRGDGGGAASAARPGIRLQELAGVVGAVAETRVVEALVRAVHLLGRVAIHEEVHRHDARRLGVDGECGCVWRDSQAVIQANTHTYLHGCVSIGYTLGRGSMPFCFLHALIIRKCSDINK